MNKFENYELYLENKSFLASENIVTFTDPSGKLLALKPDITLSILKICLTCQAAPTRCITTKMCIAPTVILPKSKKSSRWVWNSSVLWIRRWV